jgi:hypothetical protein
MASGTSKTKATAGGTAAEPVTLFNPWPAPCVYTDDGKILGGFDRVVVDAVDATGCNAIKQRWIVVKKGTAVCPPAANADAAPDTATPSQERPGESVPE